MATESVLTFNKIQSKSLNPEAVLFDLDGTLLDTMELHFKCWSEVLVKYGIRLTRSEFYAKEGTNIASLARQYLGERSSEQDIINLIALKDRMFVQEYVFKPYHGVAEFFSLLRKKNIKTGLVTAGNRERFFRSVPSWFAEAFNVCVFGDSTKLGKPNPDPYLLAISELRVAPSKCVVVENAPLGILAAKRAKTFCIAVTSTLPKETLSGADIILENFSQINQLNWSL